MFRTCTIAALSSLLAVLPGCIAWEIRDEIRTTNRHLCEVEPALVHTLHGIEETNRRIAEVHAAIQATQSQLADVQSELGKTEARLIAVSGTLDQTNPKLNNLDDGLERMRILNEVHATLKDVHKSLGPLGAAMGSLGGAMSFLGMGGDASPDLLEQEASAAQAAAAPAAGATAPAREPGAEPEVAEPAGTKRPDPILGTWVLVYPPPPAATGASTPAAATTRGRITIIMADGRFITAEDGRAPRTGRWMRQGRNLTFTYEPSDPGAAPEVESGELLTLSSRTLTIRRGDVIRVHARP